MVFTPGTTGGLVRVAAAGGMPAPLTTPKDASHRWPQFLPDGRHYLYSVVRGSGRVEIVLGLLDSNESKHLLDTASSAQYADPGYLLFPRGGTLMAQPFDARCGELAAEQLAVAQRVGENANGQGLSTFSTASNGVRTYRAGISPDVRLTWFDRSGKPLDEAAPPAEYQSPTISPDGSRRGTPDGAADHDVVEARDDEVRVVDVDIEPDRCEESPVSPPIVKRPMNPNA